MAKAIHEPVYISELIEWGAMVHAGPPTVILNKDGSYMATLSYRGRDVEMMEAAEHAMYVRTLSGLFSKLGSGWCVLSDEWHEAATAYPENTFTNPVAAFVDDSREVLFSAGLFFESDYFLTVLWQPPSVQQHTWYEQLFTAVPEAGGTHDEANLTAFLHAIVRWSDPLDVSFPAWHWCPPDETATYLHRTVSWERYGVGMPDPPVFLANALTDTGFLPGHTSQLGRLIPDTWPLRLEQFIRPLCVKSWPTTDPRTGKGGLGLFVPTALSRLPFPYRYTVRAIPLDTGDADTKLRQYQGEWETMVWGSGRTFGKQTSQAQAHIESLDRELTHGTWDAMGGHGYITPTVLVWADTEEELARREREVRKALQEQQLVMVAEDINSAQAWQGMCPGDYAHNCRRPLLSSEVPAALFAHHAIWSGQERDAHFNAAALFVASSGMSPYRYVMHVGESASTMMIGRHRCHAPGTPILMASGAVKPIEEIREGEEVMGVDSLPRKVRSLHRGRAEMAKIIPNAGKEFIVTLDHLLVLKREDDGTQYAGKLDVISVKDWMGKSDRYKKRHLLYHVPVSFPPKDSLPIHPYILGVLLGDGCLTKATPSITNQSIALKTKIRSLLRRTKVKVSKGSRSTSRCPTFSLVRRDGRIGGRGNARKNPLTEHLKSLGLFGKDSAAKFIPSAYKVASYEERLWLLAGLIDTDGTRVKNGHGSTYSYTSKSQQLIDDIFFVARSLGFIANLGSITKKAQTGNGGIYYTISLGGDVASIPVQIQRKQVKERRPKSTSHQPKPSYTIKTSTRTGFSLELIGEGDYYGFECDQDHMYLMGDCTVSHNSGKTACFTFMAMQFLRYLGAQVFLLDSDFGMYGATTMVGGTHYDLGGETALGFQPLGKIDQGYDQMVWAQGWIENLFAVQDIPLATADKSEVWEALKSVARKPKSLRTLSCFQACFQVPPRLKAGLAPFIGQGPYAFLDAQEDSFRLEDWTCFEMKKMMQDIPAALPHVMSYIFHEMEACFTGRPTLVIYDEAHAVFKHPVFAQPILTQTKTAAKKNVSMVWGTQDIIDASRTPLWQSLLNQCDNKLFTANPMATSTDILPEYLKCGVTPFQAQMIAAGVRTQDYFHLTQLGARMFQLRLSPVERLLCAASTLEEIAALRELKQQETQGALKEPLAVAWLRSRQYGREADLLRTYYDRANEGKFSHESA